MAETGGEGAHGGPYFRKERVKRSPEEEARLERQHFWRIIDVFRFYRYDEDYLKQRTGRKRRIVSTNDAVVSITIGKTDYWILRETVLMCQVFPYLNN